MTNLLTEEWKTQLSSYNRLWLGFSGGLDSTVLMHHLLQVPSLRKKLQVVHVHHGLSANANDWQSHCARVCETFSIPFQVFSPTFNRTRNIEEEARQARYEVFLSLMETNDCLVLAHHQDDQAETVLLQLFRGTGIAGLAAMPVLKTFGLGKMARPLLTVPRQALETYAKVNELIWVEDETNTSLVYARNYLRHTIFPLLKAKWPTVVDTISRCAVHCQSAQSNLDRLAALDIEQEGQVFSQLKLTPLFSFPPERLANALRFWFKANCIKCPSTRLLDQLIEDVIFAREDASPSLQWGNRIIRRYQDTLYLLQKNANEVEVEKQSWLQFPKPLMLKRLSQYLCAIPMEKGLCVPMGAKIEVGFWKPGDVFYWRKQTKSLKKLWQYWKVPPWDRANIPLLYIDGELAAVTGFAISDRYYCETATTYAFELKLNDLQTFDEEGV